MAPCLADAPVFLRFDFINTGIAQLPPEFSAWMFSNKGFVTMKINTLFALCIWFISSVAISAPVTLVSQWRYPPKYSHNDLFPIYFTYDDAALDSRAGPEVGSFDGSVLDIHYTYKGVKWSFDPTVANSILLHTTHNTAMVTFQLTAGIVSETGERATAYLGVESGRFSRDSLSVVADEIVMQYGQLYIRTGPGSENFHKLSEGLDPFVVVPQVPLPAGIYLMSSSLLGLRALRRRQSKGRAARV